MPGALPNRVNRNGKGCMRNQAGRSQMSEVLEFANKLSSVQREVHGLFEECNSVNRVGAAWAALSSATDCFARLRAEALGGDGETLRAQVDRFLLLNPNLHFSSFLQEEIRRKRQLGMADATKENGD